MICRECKHAFIGKDKQDLAMSKLGYRSCAKARSPEERAKYVRGSQVCLWKDRVK